MRLIGLIGGISPESTEIYVRLFNKAARARLGGEHSANFIVWHLDYGTMIELYRRGDWKAYAGEIAKAGAALKRAGADALMIGSNTSHVAAGPLREAAGLPVIHVLDALAAAMKKAGARRPLLLGTPVVMSGDYYRPALSRRYDGEPVIPTADEQREIGRIILAELCLGVVTDESRRTLQKIIAAHRDADSVILGCTELCLILSEDNCALPAFDTTALHAAAATAFAFGEEP